MIQRLLLLPLLSPLLVALLVGALNPRPNVVLRLLTWQSPALPIGLWMAMAAGGGAALSGGATALALRQGSGASRPRSGRRTEVWEAEGWQEPRRQTAPADPPFRRGRTAEDSAAPRPPSAGPSRAPGEPSPTVSVPYRVLHRPEKRRATATDSPAPAGAATAPEAQDWDELESEDW